MVIIIPAYNPDNHLINVLKDLKKVTNNKIIIVNDGSTGKEKIFNEAKKHALVIDHEVNKGKGAAMKTAMKYVKENMPDEDGVIFVDADGQHKATDVKKMIEAFNEHKNSLILGVRVFSNDIPKKSLIGNKLTRLVFKLYTHKYVSDTQTGLRCFSTKYIPKMLKIEGNRYEYEMNQLVEFAKSKIDIYEVPIETIYEDKKNSTSHFNPIKDSILIYKVFLKFILSGLGSAVIDYIGFILFTLLLGKEGYHIVIANILARVISSSFNYTINKNVVFKKGSNTLPKYIALVIIVLMMNSTLLYIFTNIFNIHHALAKIFVEVSLFLFSYKMQQIFIFKE